MNSNFFCLVQEPSLFKGKFRNKPNGTNSFPSSFVTENPRAAIFASNKLKFLEFPKLAACLAKICNKNVLIASVYLDQNNWEAITENLKGIIKYADDRNLPCLLGMDSNCHSTMFGPDTNSRGVILEDFIIDNHLSVENIGNTPTFRSSRYSSCIDVTLSRNMAGTIDNWKVSEDFNASNHNTITYQISGKMITIPEHCNWDKSNWEVFKKELSKVEFFRPVRMTDCKLDRLVNKLYFVINKGLDLACPIVKGILRDPLNEWFTEEMEAKRHRVASSYNKAKNTRSGSDQWRIYKKNYKAYRALVRRSKRKYWNQYKRQCGDVKQTSRLVKILQCSDTNMVSTFTKADGNNTMPGTETADYLLRSHFPNSTEAKKTRYNHVMAPSYEIEGRFSTWITKSLAAEALSKFEHKKLPGPDGLKPVIFQHFQDNILDEITFIYKSCIALAFTPSSWRNSKIIFIPKPGKTDYTLTSSFRPIAPSNYFLKGLERLCVWRLDQSLIEFPIHDRQHGFRCDRSTETAISEVTNEIEKHIYKRQRTLGVFLDMKSTFDTISPGHIRRCLLNHRAPYLLVDWYYNYITNRNVIVELQDAAVRASVSVGFPQGAVASVRFWLIAFNMAVKIINSQGCMGTAFADDCAVLISVQHPNTLIKTMQKTLTCIEAWGRKCGLNFNPSKTVVIMFGRREHKNYKNLKMGGRIIPFSTETKYLGVTLDERLNWKVHINNKLSAAKKLVYLVNQAVRGNWGPTPWLTRWAFTGIVRPALTYACAAWAHALKGKMVKKKLDRIDRLSLLSITHCAPSTPTQALRVAYGLPPTRLIIDKLAVDTLIQYKGRMALEWDGTDRSKSRNKSHLKHLWDLATPLKLNETITDDIRVASPMALYQVCKVPRLIHRTR